MVWSLVHSEDEIQATQSPFNANWDLIHCKPSTDPKSILHQSNANRMSKWGHSKLDNHIQQQFSNQLILANPCRYRPIRANPHQSMHYPNTRQFWTISCQSLTNPGSFLQVFTNSPILQSLLIFVNTCQSMPIMCQLKVNFKHNSPICQLHQAVPIHANSLPIAYQSSVNPCQSFVNLGPFQGQYSRSTTIFQSANLGQAMPIRQSSANPCQSVPIRCQSANPSPIGQSQANPPIRCQSYVITEAIPALNLGTSALYGEVPSRLGG